MSIALKSLRLAALFFLLYLPVASADPVVPPLTGRVVDLADVLTSAAERDLTTELAKVEQKTGTQIVVAILPDLGRYPIEAWGLALGRTWQIGRAGKDDGIVIVLAPKDREIRIEVGYGLEGDIPDAKANQIIQHILVPAFRKGRYATGLEEAIGALEKLIVNPEAQVTEDNPYLGVYVVLLLCAGIAVVLWMAFWAYPKGDDRSPSRNDTNESVPPERDVSTASESDDGDSFWRSSSRRSSWSSSSSSSSRSSRSSFSGRGGSFGGGGASGKW
ncbi:YgcG family protein [Dongia mobilis]|uniref:TPM domain-containing protein n=1 Tax=Dongia sp. TaxID=1977262 RepID=UPI0026ECD7AE